MLSGPTPIATAAEDAPTRGWAVLIAALRDDPEAARAALQKTKTVAKLTDAYLAQENGTFVLLYGDFESPATPAARDGLAKVRGVDVNGDQPFASAILVPPPERVVHGALPEYSLTTVRAKRGRGVTLYTLQIAQYERPDAKTPSHAEITEFRRAAEKAATDLRRDGEEAYYFHGPTFSNVTVGVYTPKEFDPAGPRAMDPPSLQAARKKHPDMLVNGQGVKRRAAGSQHWDLAPTIMVEVP